MTQTREWLRRAAAVTVAAGVALTGAPVGAASAAAPLTAGVVCYAEGAGSFICWVGIAGGTAPYSTVWSGASFSEVYTTGASGKCTPGRAYTVSATVTDTAAGRVVDPAYFVCRGGPPI
ncbi:hypothetical protein [Actinoplanes sichuanensis]|uniref:Ig-like domain-containing protein n=1 Tax=Actinoplanes sichuanensis TaxID=512349 RepID=A0ABW4A9W8_9ACTN|nr:hypothetical protein [Actinoplanes sichuanensis]